MSLITAILVGFVYYISTLSIAYTAYDLLLWPIFGLILGDVKTTMIVYATVTPIYLAFTGAGGTVVSDKTAAIVMAIVMVVKSGVSLEASMGIAVSMGIIFAQLHTIRRIFFATFVQMADKYAEDANTRGIILAGTIWPQLSKIIIFWLPMSLLLYLGTDFVGAVINGLPEWAMNGLTAAGKVMPALGFALTVRVIARKELIPYFIGGFFIAKVTGISIIAMAVFSGFIAFMDMRFNVAEGAGQQEESLFAKAASANQGKGERLLDKKDITNTFLRWFILCEWSNSFARLQTLSFCITYIPILQKLYPDNKEELVKGLQRHLVFFNTQGIWGSIIHGIVLSMEEQRALGMPITDDAIISLKTGLIGPFAGIGDTIDWATLLPLMTVMFLPYAAQGHWWSTPVCFLLFNSIIMAEGLFFTHLGYGLGTTAALSIMQSQQLKRLLTFFCVLGLLMMGGLSATMVNVTTPIVINAASESPLVLQKAVFDAIIPGLLTLGTVFAIYWYLQRGNTMTKTTLVVLAISLVLGFLGILG